MFWFFIAAAREFPARRLFLCHKGYKNDKKSRNTRAKINYYLAKRKEGVRQVKVQTSRCGAELCIKLIGDMDEYSAADARRICDKLLDENSSADRVIINLAEVAFMDSTGIGFLIGRYKKAKKMGIPLAVEKPNFAADKVLSLSGIYALIPRAD